MVEQGDNPYRMYRD